MCKLISQSNDVTKSIEDELYPMFFQTLSSPEQVLHTPVKRGIGCQEINSTTYTTDGATFNILCDTSYSGLSWTSILYINYTTDFVSCLGGCAEWNTKMSQKCLGVTLAYDQYGPHGGSECYFFWELEESAAGVQYDSGQLQISGEPPVCFHKSCHIHKLMLAVSNSDPKSR
jgi:hypothetical protein